MSNNWVGNDLPTMHKHEPRKGDKVWKESYPPSKRNGVICKILYGHGEVMVEWADGNWTTIDKEWLSEFYVNETFGFMIE